MVEAPNRSVRVALLAAALVLATAVYAPGLSGPFIFDDFPNIVWNPFISIERIDLGSMRDAAFSAAQSVPGRGLARITFALNYHLAGGVFDELAFKATNLAIHLLNGVLVYLLSALLLRRYAGGVRGSHAEAGWNAMRGFVPLAVAAVWLLHPIQLTSVLYVVQRMTSLSATFVLAGLIVFVLGRSRLEEGRPRAFAWMLGGIGGGGALGVLCKENAALIPFLALLVELAFFRRDVLAPASRRRLSLFWGLVAVLPALLVLGAIAANTGLVLDQYEKRSFTLVERLLTQARALFFYVGLLVFPNIRAYGLYHDDFPLSTGLLDPWTTLPAVLGLATVAAVTLAGLRRKMLWAFGAAWFLVGHAMESSVIALELVHEHRNYLPSFGLVLAGVFYLSRLVGGIASTRRMTAPLLVMLVAVLAFATFVRAGIWEDRRTLTTFMTKNHPGSYRTLVDAGIAEIIEGADVRETFELFQRAASVDPDTVTPLFEMAKIVAGLRAAIAVGDVEPAPEPEPPASVDPLADPMRIAPGWLARAGEALDRLLRERLAVSPVTAETVLKLQDLQRCARSGYASCAPLVNEIIDWHRIAIASRRVHPDEIAAIEMSLARIYAAVGEQQLAVDHARAASAAEPDHLGHRFDEGMLYVHLARWPELERLLGELEAQGGFDVFRDRVIARLREEAETARGR